MSSWFAENRSLYPPNWEKIAKRLKKKANYKCQWCGKTYEENGMILTVHHLDRNPANCSKNNLVVLCQKCHLYIQSNNLDSLFHKEQQKLDRGWGKK
jgi:5-methylcytosine-specific restriction endonuclease McrA